MPSTPTENAVLSALEQVTGESEVRRNRELPLFELQILDSLRAIELLVELRELLGVDIAVSEIDRELWATPARIVEFVEARLAA